MPPPTTNMVWFVVCTSAIVSSRVVVFEIYVGNSNALIIQKAYFVNIHFCAIDFCENVH